MPISRAAAEAQQWRPGGSIRVLFSNNTLAYRAGSELYVRDVAIRLKRRGHHPVAYSTILGPVAEDLRAAGVPTIDDLRLLAEEPDVIHGHHHLDAAASILRFPGAPAIHACHGWLPWQESPLVLASIRRYVAISDLTREYLLTSGASPDRIAIILNFVDRERFSTCRDPAPIVRRAVAYGNSWRREAPALAAVRAACEHKGIEFEAVPLGNPIERPETFLPAFDVVFALGRSALEAMACGCGVVLADPNGFGGLVTNETFARLRATNFGFGAIAGQATTAEAVTAALEQYDSHDVARVAQRVRTEADIETAIDQWEAQYALSIAEGPAPLHQVMADASIYLVKLKALTSHFEEDWHQIKHASDMLNAALQSERAAFAAERVLIEAKHAEEQRLVEAKHAELQSLIETQRAEEQRLLEAQRAQEQRLIEAKRAEEQKFMEAQVDSLAQLRQANQTLGERLVLAEDRAAAAETWRATILPSSSWRLSQQIHFLLGDKPGGLKRLVRRSPKLLLWTVTLQLPNRWRLWRQTHAEVDLGPALAPPTLATPDTAAETITGRNSLPETALASAQRLEILENRAATLESALEMERGRIDVALSTSLASAHQRTEVLEYRATNLESLLELERGRIDWVLGSVEGVTAQIDAYHAYRETADYKAAYASSAPLVSVCVATLDRANLLLERSVASIRAQSYRNLQIVVVGDNCSDDTALRLASLGDDRIQFINLPQRGPYPRPGIDRWYVAGSNAMNQALSLCEGQFVTHLDDDDAMVPHRIEALIAAALQYRADFLWHTFWCENSNGTWEKLGNGRLELGQVSTGSIFYHRYFAQFPWDVHSYRLREPGDWNRLRKLKVLRPRMRFVDEPLLYHHVEQAQPGFVARDGERFLE